MDKPITKVRKGDVVAVAVQHSSTAANSFLKTYYNKFHLATVAQANRQGWARRVIFGGQTHSILVGYAGDVKAIADPDHQAAAKRLVVGMSYPGTSWDSADELRAAIIRETKQLTFEQDKKETPVLFRKMRGKQYENDGVTAVFPCEPHDLLQGSCYTMSCYMHVGQHGGCSYRWYRATVAAKPEEYASLKAELEGAPFGYRLKVYQRMQPWMREARDKEARRLRSHNK
jgi:hypothetical protein